MFNDDEGIQENNRNRETERNPLKKKMSKVLSIIN